MENNIERLSKRSIVILLTIIPVACLLALITSSVILPGSQWPPNPSSIAAAIVSPIIFVGFLIYGSNLKDERSVDVSNRAVRNGFAFVLFVTPTALVVLTLTGASVETMMVLLFVCLGMIAVACISAFYYYHK